MTSSMNRNGEKTQVLRRETVFPYIPFIRFAFSSKKTMPKSETKTKSIKASRTEYYTLGYNSYRFSWLMEPEFYAISKVVESNWQINNSITVAAARKALRHALADMRKLYGKSLMADCYYEGAAKLNAAIENTKQTLELMVTKGWLRKSGRTVVPVPKKQ